MVCLLLGFSFLVAFVNMDIVLLGYFRDRLHMGLFSTVVFVGFLFVYWTFFVLPGFYSGWGAQEF